MSSTVCDICAVHIGTWAMAKIVIGLQAKYWCRLLERDIQPRAKYSGKNYYSMQRKKKKEVD